MPKFVASPTLYSTSSTIFVPDTQVDARLHNEQLRAKLYGGDDPLPPLPKDGKHIPVPNIETLDPNKVVWDGPDDPENPQNFSRMRKWVITLICTLVTVNVYVFLLLYPREYADFLLAPSPRLHHPPRVASSRKNSGRAPRSGISSPPSSFAATSSARFSGALDQKYLVAESSSVCPSFATSSFTSGKPSRRTYKLSSSRVSSVVSLHAPL